MRSQQRRRVVLLASGPEVHMRLSRLRPRDCDFVTYEVAVPADATVAPGRPEVADVLANLPVAQRLLAGVAAGPVLGHAIEATFAPGGSTTAGEIIGYLAEPFPPRLPVPVLAPPWLDPVRALALGYPGEPVAHGLFPSTPTKLARLALAFAGDYAATVVRAAAECAYGPDRNHRNGLYHAHDAFACALVHPGVDATELVARYGGQNSRQRGWRSRHKTHQLITWARANGYRA